MQSNYRNIMLLDKGSIREIVHYLNGCESVKKRSEQNGRTKMTYYEGNGEVVQAILSGHILFNHTLNLIAFSNDLEMHPGLEKAINIEIKNSR